jgi:hypothetical protein
MARLEEHEGVFWRFHPTMTPPIRPRRGTTWGVYWYRREDFAKAVSLDHAIVNSADFADAYHWLADTFVCQQEYRRRLEFELAYLTDELHRRGVVQHHECYEKSLSGSPPAATARP